MTYNESMGNAVNISRRGLRPGEAKVISEEITRTPNIVGYKAGELVELGDMLVAENEDGLIGILAYVETGRFIDLKLAIVIEKYRGRGYGTQLFNECMSLLNNKGKPMYAVTKNPTVVHALQTAGFNQVRFRQLPLSCRLHQLRMFLSLYRSREYLRKLVRFPKSGRFSYWLKPV